jgi:hypothetical protein
MACLQSTRRVRMCALQSEGKIILIYSYFEIRVYFHPYYDMTLGYKSLFLRKFSFITYTCTYAYVLSRSPWHLTNGLVTASYRYLTALCFHENCQLVVIISHVWDDRSPLFCRASGGSTLFTLGNPYIMELPRFLIICMDMGIPFFCCAVGFNPLV